MSSRHRLTGLKTPILVRAFAFYLPQFHPIPENDEWWGTGLHRVDERRAGPAAASAATTSRTCRPTSASTTCGCPRPGGAGRAGAGRHGIDGFCYYHYWFDGRRLLERPFDEVLGQRPTRLPLLPLLGQRELDPRPGTDGPEVVLLDTALLARRRPSRTSATSLPGVRRPPLRQRIDGKPACSSSTGRRSCPTRAGRPTRWREEAARLGVGELYLCAVESGPDEHADPVDARLRRRRRVPAGLARLRWQRTAARPAAGGSASASARAVGYATHRVYSLRRTSSTGCSPREPAVAPPLPVRDAELGQLAAPRDGGASILHELDARALRAAGCAARSTVRPPRPDQDLVFVNAWNEWAEGAHLEPDHRWGHAYLEATRAALREGDDT